MEKESLERLEKIYTISLQVCDPVEYLSRQKRLLECIAECLMSKLKDIREKERLEEGHESILYFPKQDSWEEPLVP